jgi:hypothetical protein
LISPAVACRVAAEEDFGWRDDERSATDRKHTSRKHQLVEEDHAPVHAAVAVVVVQHDHRAHRRVFTQPVGVGHESAHLADPQPAVRVEAGHHGIVDERLGSDQFDHQVVGYGEGGQSVGGGEHRRCRNSKTGGQIMLHGFGSVLAVTGLGPQ